MFPDVTIPTNPPKKLWVYNTTSKRYYNPSSGRFIGHNDMIELRNDFMGQQSAIVENLAEKLRNKDITLRQWETQLKQTIKESYIDQYAMSCGGRHNMTQQDWGRIGAMLKEQYGVNGYLKGFYNQIAQGNLSEAQIAARAKMYIRSSNNAYQRALTRGLPIDLPAYPGDGATQCLTNCQCSWQIIEVEDGYDCYWRLGRAEHCPDCVDNANRWNPYHIRIEAGE